MAPRKPKPPKKNSGSEFQEALEKLLRGEYDVDEEPEINGDKSFEEEE